MVNPLFFKSNCELNSIYQSFRSYKYQFPDPDGITGGLRVQGIYKKKSNPGKPLVSIVTVVRNGAATLEKTIQSVLDQTYDNIEYIIIDGGSTDNTVDIIRKYENQIAYWVSESDKGISDAFNKGIVFSTGEMIGLINSDDWYSREAVQVLANEYIKTGECVFHGKLKYWTRDMKQYYVFSGSDDKIWINSTINHPTVFVPRSIYDRIGLFGFQFRYAMDYEWLLRAKVQNVKFHYVDKVIANMSLCGSSDIHWGKSYIEVMRARNLHGMNPIKNFLLFLNMVVVTLFRKSLEYIGLNRVVTFYRKYYSVVKKERL